MELNIQELNQQRFIINDVNDNIIADKKKQKRIDNEIKDFMRKQSIFVRIKWSQIAPVGNTGNLKRKGLYHTGVKKEPFGYGFTFGLKEVETKGSPDEWRYPLFVNEGTDSPIRPKGNVLKLRDKKSGFVFAKKKQVSGQPGQEFMQEIQRRLRTNFDGIETTNLGRKIQAILAE